MYSPSSLRLEIYAVVLALAAAANAATIGVLQLADDRQLPNLNLLDPAMSAARNALIADGHAVTAVSAINATQLSGVRILWLPLLESDAFYTQDERDSLRAYFDGGGRIVWIGDAGIYNLGDDSFLSAFGIAKLAGTYDTDGPILSAASHPTASGPYGTLASPIAVNATFGLFSLAAADVPATTLYTDAAGPGSFIALLRGDDVDQGGRAALVCDSAIFADQFDENGGAHRTILRNTIAWLAQESSYTPAGTNIAVGPIAGACEACVGVSITFAHVTTTGQTFVSPIAAGQSECGFSAAPFGDLPDAFVGFAFHVTTSAQLSAGSTATVTISYNSSALAAAGFRNESAIELYKYDVATGQAVQVTSQRDVVAKTITGQSVGVGAYLLGAIIPLDDCDNDGVPDACRIDADSVAPGGPFYCVSGCDADCNENGVLDACDVREYFAGDSPELSPIGAGSTQAHTFGNLPRAVSSVVLLISARGDFSAASEYIDLHLNGALIGRAFESGATDCPVTPSMATLHVAPETFNALSAGGTATVTMTPSSAVDASLCTPPSHIQVRLSYEGESIDADCNANGIPDDCESNADCDADGVRDLCAIAAGTAQDCNTNGVPDHCEIASGASDDCNANDVPDECEGPFFVTMAREPANGGAVHPVGGSPRGVCETINITATPAEGHCFTGWTVSAGAPAADPSAEATTVIADEPKTITGHFTRIILTEPFSMTGCPGGEARFTIELDPSILGDAVFEWRKGGQPVSGEGISGENTAELVIAPINASHAGSYSCVVMLPCGTAASASAGLIVGVDTQLVTDAPEAVSACVGGTTALSVAASGSAVTYQWQYAEVESFDNLQNGDGVSGANSATLILSNLSPAHAGQYRCVMSGVCGAGVISSATTLSVGVAPGITSESGGAVICEGETFTASVSAEGTDLSYQWYFNGGALWMPIQPDAPGVSGANTPELTIENAQPANTGSYRCIVTGQCPPNAQSAVVSLTVRASTRILEAPINVSRCPGQSATMNVTAIGTALAYQWQFDNGGGFVNITGGAQGYSGATTPHLTISSISAVHAGAYRCVVTGSCGDPVVSDAASLTVATPAAIVNPLLPADAASCPGGMAVFTVQASGDGLTYQWQANTGPAFISLSDGPNVSGAQSHTLVLTGVPAAIAGRYHCVVAGGCVPAQVSREAVLTVTNEVCDCNANSTDDAADISTGFSSDCNANGVPDECEIDALSDAPGGPYFCAAGCATDCNANGVPDACDIAGGTSMDCNANGIPDECEIDGGTGPSTDCNANGVPDACDIASGASDDCNKNGIPDECEPPYLVDAGPDKHVCAGQATLLLGPVVASGSRPPYNYEWQIISGPAGATLQAATSTQPVFHASQIGQYVVQVTVRDATNPPCTKTDTVNVVVYAMSVNAGPNLSLGVGQTSAPLAPFVSGGVGTTSFEWKIEPGSPSLEASQFAGSGPLSAGPTFRPSLPGQYTLRVTARDANAPNACAVSDTLIVNSVLMTLGPPADFAMCVGSESLPLATTITSPGISPHSFAWSIEPGSPNLSPAQFTGSGAASSAPTFSPTAAGLYELRVTVTDSGSPPAVAHSTVRVNVGGLQVTLPAEISQCADGPGIRLPRPIEIGGVAPLTYIWTVEPGAPSTDPAQFADESAYDAAWLFKPASPGSYMLRLTTTDSASPPCIRSTLMTVRATAMTIDAGADFVSSAFTASKPLGALPLLAGASANATFEWRILSGPTLDAKQFSSTTVPRPVFSPADVGTFALEVTARDGDCVVSDVVVVESITAHRTLNTNSEGRVFMSLRIDEPHAAAEIRVAGAEIGAAFTGDLRDMGGTADSIGMADGARVTRRLKLTTDAHPREFVALVGMLYTSYESGGLTNAALLRLHTWDTADGLWRRATSGALENASFPSRPTKGDVGRSGVQAMPALGNGVYLAWAVVNYAGDFAVGLPSEEVAPYAPKIDADDISPEPGQLPGLPGSGLCGAGGSGSAMILGLMAPALVGRWRRRR